MQIRTIKANNFKSLVEFEIDLARFSCLIGLNGAGKSTVLQFIDFLGQQARGNIEGWLEGRKWSIKDLKSKLSKKKKVDFEVKFEDESGEPCSWTGSFNTQLLRCTSEAIRVQGVEFDVHEGHYYIIEPDGVSEASGNGTRSGPGHGVRINFDYDGSLLSQLKESMLPEPLIRFKEHVTSIHSLDLLAPESLRQRTRESEGSLGLGGQRLSAFWHELGTAKRRQLVGHLKSMYPQLEDVGTRSLKSGWKQLEVTETYQGDESGFFPGKMTTEARHVADGILRLIAVFAEMETDHQFLLFDEIENGINPELVEFVLAALTTTQKQVLVTTHSPMILNYLSDEVAKAGVIYLYKTPQGATRTIPFFSIPSLAEKLTVMGPGEAFVDTNLTELSEEIQAVPVGQ